MVFLVAQFAHLEVFEQRLHLVKRQLMQHAIENGSVTFDLRHERALTGDLEQILRLLEIQPKTEGELNHLIARRSARAVEELVPIAAFNLRALNHAFARNLPLCAEAGEMIGKRRQQIRRLDDVAQCAFVQ